MNVERKSLEPLAVISRHNKTQNELPIQAIKSQSYLLLHSFHINFIAAERDELQNSPQNDKQNSVSQ